MKRTERSGSGQTTSAGTGRRRARTTLIAVAAAAALTAPAASAKPPAFKRLFTVNASTAQTVAMARTPDGTLHLVFQTFAGKAFSGLGTEAISKAGKPGPVTHALSAWSTGLPGLVAYPNGTLQAFFGAISPANVSSVWGITSTNGGATWSAPSDVRSSANTALAYGSDITAVLSAGTPVLSLPQGGNLVIQSGLGPTAPTTVITNSSDGAATSSDLAVDATTGEVVAGWKSIAHSLREYLQGVSPKIGIAQAVPGQDRNAIIPSGRDAGAGVFAAYTGDGTHVRLLRYGGGSVSVGHVKGLPAKALGTATGLDGRIWVIWGSDSPSGIAVTRSNKAVTRFEPVQRLDPKAFTLNRVSGDGRLGPLDLLVNELPAGKNTVLPPAELYARVLPALTATVKVKDVKNKKGHVVAHTFTVLVTDAGDAVSGATAATGGKKHQTNSKGKAVLTVSGGDSGKATVVVTRPGYATVKLHVAF